MGVISIFPPRPNNYKYPNYYPPFHLPYYSPAYPGYLNNLPPRPSNNYEFNYSKGYPNFYPYSRYTYYCASATLMLTAAAGIYVEIRHSAIAAASAVISCVGRVAADADVVAIAIAGVCRFAAVGAAAQSVGDPALATATASAVARASLSHFNLAAAASAFALVDVRIVSSALSCAPVIFRSIRNFADASLLFTAFKSSQTITAINRDSSF